MYLFIAVCRKKEQLTICTLFLYPHVCVQCKTLTPVQVQYKKIGQQNSARIKQGQKYLPGSLLTLRISSTKLIRFENTSNSPESTCCVSLVGRVVNLGTWKYAFLKYYKFTVRLDVSEMNCGSFLKGSVINMVTHDTDQSTYYPE